MTPSNNKCCNSLLEKWAIEKAAILGANEQNLMKLKYDICKKLEGMKSKICRDCGGDMEVWVKCNHHAERSANSALDSAISIVKGEK